MTRIKLLTSIPAAVLSALALAVPAHADDFVVNDFGSALDANPGTGECDTTPDGPPIVCTLRAAVHEANINPAGPVDNVTFSVTGTHTLGSLVSSPMTITGNGSGAAGTVIDGGDADRHLFALDTLTLTNMRFQNGRRTLTGSGGGGGSIESNAALTLNNVTVTGNDVDGDPGAGMSATGGGIYVSSSAATVKINRSTISGNAVDVPTGSNAGGGISVAGNLIIDRSTISGNSILSGVFADGGGVYAASGLDIANTTLSGNSASVAGGAGGGLYVVGNAGTKSILNSTISGNSSGAGGGGGMRTGGPSVSVGSTTFSGNTSVGAGADIRNETGTTTLKNTILGSAGACSLGLGTIASDVPGHNIDAGTSCALGTTTGNKESADPLLAPLGAYGGPNPTPTHGLLAGSPAVDMASPDCGGLSTDQRGEPRPLGLACDIGAFEGTVVLPPPPSGGGTVTPATTTPAVVKKCGKKKRLKKGKCVKRKRKKK